MAIEIVSNFFLYGLLIAGTSITILLRHWMGFYQRKNELEKVNLKTELESLKDQINPEFLLICSMRQVDRPSITPNRHRRC